MIIPSNDFFKRFKETPGALSCCEAIAISNITSDVIPGNYFEAGSNAGKSGMAAAFGLPKGKFYMCDPIFDLTNLEAWEHTIQKHPDNLAWDYAAAKGFKDAVIGRIKFASKDRVEPILLGSYSEKEIPLHGDYSYVFIDSDNHSHERVFGEVELVKNRMVSGGVIAFHDFLNQYISPAQAHKYLIETGEYEDIPIDWTSIFNYVRENNLEDGNNTWHQSGSEEFPKFVGAVRKK